MEKSYNKTDGTKNVKATYSKDNGHRGRRKRIQRIYNCLLKKTYKVKRKM
jgi:hypothetical protein